MRYPHKNYCVGREEAARDYSGNMSESNDPISAISGMNVGLTKLEYMATHLMASLLVTEKFAPERAATIAVSAARDLMKELNKQAG